MKRLATRANFIQTIIDQEREIAKLKLANRTLRKNIKKQTKLLKRLLKGTQI